jgi:hypothetical protein
MREIGLGQDPARCPLEHLHRTSDFDQFRNDLDGAGTGADHCHPLVCHVVVVIPAGAEDLMAGVGVQAANIGKTRIGKGAVCHHDRSSVIVAALVGFGGPGTRFVIEVKAGDSDPEPNEPPKCVLVDDALDVLEDLAAA